MPETFSRKDYSLHSAQVAERAGLEVHHPVQKYNRVRRTYE